MISITLQTLEGKKTTMKVKKGMSIMDLKEKIMLTINGKDPGQQRLIYNLTRLDDEKYLNDYGIEEGAIIHIVTPLASCSCKKDILGYCVKGCNC